MIRLALIIISIIFIIFVYFLYNISYYSLIISEIYSPLRKRKTDYYKLALQKSIETGKPLLVIGDPESGAPINRHIMHSLIGTPYEYGDLCIDLTGCPKNPNGKSIKGKLENIIPNFDDNSYVIFTSQLVEYIDNNLLDNVLQHLIRVSGGDLFMVNMNYRNDSYTDSLGVFVRKNYILKCPPEHNYIEYAKYNPTDQDNEHSKFLKC